MGGGDVEPSRRWRVSFRYWRYKYSGQCRCEDRCQDRYEDSCQDNC